MAIHIFKSPLDIMPSLAENFVKIANEAIQENGICNIVLAGGNSPQKLYELLTTDAYKTQVDWRKIYFFFGDERYVPADDPQSNSFMVQKALFNPLKISQSHIFKIDTTLSPVEAAKKYDATIVSHFKNKRVEFDLILLGLGDNAHTASLFPFTPILSESTATVMAVFLKEQNSTRITMTAPLINQSKHIVFLVYGKEKAEAVYHVLKYVQDVAKYPAQLINPVSGELQWFLDEAAASLL